MLDEGVYKAKAKSWVLCEAKTGTEQVAVQFELTSEGFAGYQATWYGFLTEKTYERTIESLRHCGWTGDDISNLEGLDENEVELVVEHEHDQEGKLRSRVKWVNKPGAGGLAAPMAPDKAKVFAAAMRSKIRALDAAGGRKPAQSKPAPKQSTTGGPPPHDDSDRPPF